MKKRFKPHKVFFSNKKDGMDNLSEQEQHGITGGHGATDHTEYDWQDNWDEGNMPVQTEGNDLNEGEVLVQPMSWGEGEDGWEDWEEDEEDYEDEDWEDEDGEDYEDEEEDHEDHEDGEDEEDEEDYEDEDGEDPEDDEDGEDGEDPEDVIEIEEVEVIGHPEDPEEDDEDEDWDKEDPDDELEDEEDPEDVINPDDPIEIEEVLVTAKQNDPCEGAQKANALKNNSSVANEINNIRNSSTEIGYKFYVDDPSDYSSFRVGDPIPGSQTQWGTNFTWDDRPSGGYTTGHMHNHPQGGGPSASDAMVGIKLDQMESERRPDDVNFYTKNFTAVIVSGSEVYTITIKDAEKYKTYQKNFYEDPAAAKATWDDHAQDYRNIYPSATHEEAGEYALLKMYGDAINLTQQGVNDTNNNKELKLNSSGIVTPYTPCPT